MRTLKLYKEVDDMKGSKYCHKCNKWKVVDDFYKDKHSTTGRMSWCKECVKTHNREYNRTKNQNKKG